VLDIDRDRQRISLGLKQTQSDPWQQVLENYSVGDVVEGRVTKVVTFGAFVEILPGVEGLVHISELAQHHVENPREVVAQGQAVNVVILEVDADRRRLSLSLKRVDEGAQPRPRADGAESVHLTPQLDLSEEVFTESSAAVEVEADEEAPPEGDESIAETDEPLDEVEEPAAEADESIAETDAPLDEVEEPVAEADEPIAEVEDPAAEAAELGDEADPLEVAAEDSAVAFGAAPTEPVEPEPRDDERGGGF